MEADFELACQIIEACGRKDTTLEMLVDSNSPGAHVAQRMLDELEKLKPLIGGEKNFKFDFTRQDIRRYFVIALLEHRYPLEERAVALLCLSSRDYSAMEGTMLREWAASNEMLLRLARQDLSPLMKLQMVQKANPYATIDDLDSEVRRLAAIKAATGGTLLWLCQPLVMQKPEMPKLHKLLHELAGEKTVYKHGPPGIDSEGKRLADFAYEFDKSTQVVLVQHDWAGAFANAEGLDEGVFTLPFEKCAFEFRISGKNVIVLVAQHEDDLLQSVIFVDTDAGWLSAGRYMPMTTDKWVKQADDPEFNNPITRMITAQIRAVCIMLEADVAEAEFTPAPVKLNKARVKRGALPLPDHYVVHLAKRHRQERVEPKGGTHASPRCHFRRSHIRMLSSGKEIKVRWTIVGDPDLGWVDKYYRA